MSTATGHRRSGLSVTVQRVIAVDIQVKR
jgi:hypothetical protein